MSAETGRKSPAIDAVPLADCTDANGVPVPTDQRGVARPQGTACDIGSVELRPLTALGPAEVWLGLGSPELGVKFDLSAEVRVDDTLVGSGQVNSVSAGVGTGYFLAKLRSISLAPDQRPG